LATASGFCEVRSRACTSSIARSRASADCRRQSNVRASQASLEDVTPVIEDLIRSLRRFHEVLNAGSDEERKAVVRAFLQEIRVRKATRQVTLRWYRLPRTDESLKMVELRGLEPLTPRLPALCSPN
jgi:hypothetical protein